VREKIRRQWVAFVAFGVAVVTLGFVALGAIGFATLASAVVLGWLFVLAGVMQTTHALRVRRWGGSVRMYVAGILSLAVGVVILANPAASELRLELLVATFFMVGGIVRIAAARSSRFPGRHYAFISDVVTVLLGIVIAVEWPMSGAWAVGTLVGIALIFDGWSLVMAGVAAHELGQRSSRHLRLVRRTIAG
jgi:uncharacterized membrane protein HdeD (DUF308 family)